MFEGFSDRTNEFFIGIMINNEKSWFMAHKPDYENFVLKPLKELADETTELLEAAFPGSSFTYKATRIYRDARRLFGRGPYKNYMWFTVYRDMRIDNAPAFWLEIGPDSMDYGMGFYTATPAQMESMRKTIDADPEGFRRLAERFAAQSEFLLEGDEYKKPKADRGELINAWYNKRMISLNHHGVFDEAAKSPDLPERLAKSFGFLMPYYDFFIRFSATAE